MYCVCNELDRRTDSDIEKHKRPTHYGSASVYTGVPPCPFHWATGNFVRSSAYRFFGQIRDPKIKEMTNRTRKM